jgi:hypothetical protein
VAYLTEVLPISINGIGLRESAFVFLFPLVGGLGEQGLALSLLIILIRYLQGTVGGAVLVVSQLQSEPSERKD